MQRFARDFFVKSARKFFKSAQNFFKSYFITVRKALGDVKKRFWRTAINSKSSAPEGLQSVGAHYDSFGLRRGGEAAEGVAAENFIA